MNSFRRKQRIDYFESTDVGIALDLLRFSDEYFSRLTVSKKIKLYVWTNWQTAEIGLVNGLHAHLPD